MIERHPVTIRLYGWGLPTLSALAVAGWPFAVFVGLIAGVLMLVGWK